MRAGIRISVSPLRFPAIASTGSRSYPPKGTAVSFKDLSISKKLIATFCALMSVCLLATGGVLLKAIDSTDAGKQLVNVQRIVTLVDGALAAMLEQAVNQQAYLLTRNDSAYNGVTTNRELMRQRIDAAREASVDRPELLASLDSMQKAADVYHAELAAPQLAARKTTEAPIAEIIEIGRNATKGQLEAFREAAEKIKGQAELLAQEQVERQARAHFGLLAALVGGGMVAAVVAVLLIWGLSRVIVRPIVGMTTAMGRLAGGDNAIEVPALDRKDEVGRMAQSVLVFRQAAIEKLRLENDTDQLRGQAEAERRRSDEDKAREAAETRFAMEALAEGLAALARRDVGYRLQKPFAPHLDALRLDFNNSLEALQEALRVVGRNADAINNGASEIRASADDLSGRTEQQAASIEETAAALEQITTTVRDSTKRAEDAGALVETTRRSAEKSGEIVRNAVNAMVEIEKSSSEIGNIIGVIDEIAFQTTLLALNAGVEAARAGEAGRGFAVVAQEVRELAQRTAHAAKEIKTLITSSGEQVRAGVNLVGETGSALEGIVVEVQKINELVAGIVGAAREQSTGLNEINAAVMTMDRGTQQNAAMVEQQNAATNGLAQEAAELNRLIGQFRFGEDVPAQASNVQEKPMKAASPEAGPRAMTKRLARAFGSSQAAAVVEDQWTEF